MDINRRISFLQNVSIFSESPADLLCQIAENLEEMEVSEGDDIVLKGEMGDSMYILINGKVKVHDQGHVFSILKAGDVFGKYYLIDKKQRSATVTALNRSFLFRFHQDVFYAVTKNENTVIRGILKALVSRLRDMNVAEETLAFQNTEIIRQKEELERQKKELQELNNTKDKFFSIIAHDLRSPISTLVSLAGVLRTDLSSLTPEEVHEIMTSFYDISKNYLKLLDNLLQWSRIQTGGLTPVIEPIDMIPLIEEITGFYQFRAIEKKVELIDHASGSVMVQADKNMVRTILRNLISNALKYTEPGGRVEVTIASENSWAEISVRDTGTGMSKVILEKLFHPEQTFSMPGTNSEKGTGLGLILCKEFVGKNGGIISVESKPGEGSCFSFTLPLS